jgi:hypothetical protein
MRNLISKVKGWFTPTEKKKDYLIEGLKPHLRESNQAFFDEMRGSKSNGSGKEVTVKMDVFEEMRNRAFTRTDADFFANCSERAKIMELDPAEIVEHAKQNLKEEFDALPFGRISDGAKEAIIRIVREDAENRAINYVDVLRRKTNEALNHNIQQEMDKEQTA